MSLSIISPSNIEKEMQSLISIYNSIENTESIIFNSGAGAGKTYALIESLRYVIRNYEKSLKKHNQQIICITYTNVATREVKERLGNSDIVLVSTIHERIWGLIKQYQKELVEIHKEKLIEEISILQNKIITNKEFEKYLELDDAKKEKFKRIMLENKELFYQNYNVKAAEFKMAFQTLLEDFSEILKNVSNFRKIINTIYKLERNLVCLENINLNKKEYKFVEYTFNYNNDQLHNMKISHDTLLEYGQKIFEKYDTLKQIVIDKYPFVFIDEYQDTNEKIVSIMSSLDNYAKKIGHKLFIGYFGDTAQNIYDDGVGSKINDIHIGLKPINKEFNRRSTKEVIGVINHIRNDNIKQVSIYNDCGGGSIKFYKGAQENVSDFINKYVHEWNISSANKLHCLVLTNKVVAEFSGFKNIYEAFRETGKYKGINYNQLNTELLNNDLSKLGEVPKLLFSIIKLHKDILNNKTPVLEILSKKSLFDKLNIEDLRKLINLLKQIKGKTLGEYITSISAFYTSVNNEIYEKIMDLTFGYKITSCEIFKNFLLEKLFNDITDENLDYANKIIQQLLDIEMNEYELWYKFIIDKQEENINYHTYHGTKGREFDNVIIIMENAFGKTRDYFSFFFKNLSDSSLLQGAEKYLYEKVKNLLYVSCSRAIKNLRVFYLDEISNFESGIENIFGQIYSYNCEDRSSI